MMTVSQALTAFIAGNFPGWGCCHFLINWEHRTLYIHPKTTSNRTAVLNDYDRIAQLDISIDQFIVIHPDYPAATIAAVKNSI